jgi:hypothetical protein
MRPVTTTSAPPSRQVEGAHAPRGTSGRRLRDALDRNVFAVLVLAVCGALHVQFVRGALGPDSWYTVLGGRIVSSSGLPRHDTLAILTHGRDWVDQQWLAHLGFYALWSAGGWRLALLSVVALYLAAFVVAAAAARRLGASDRSVAVIIVVCYVAGLANSALRAQIPAYLLFAFVLALLLADAERPSRRVYLVFPLLALWANVHGSVVLGAGLVALRGLTIAGSGLRAREAPRAWLPRAGALVVLPWLCTLVSPYGLALPHYYRSVLGNSAIEHAASEWGPTTFANSPVFVVLLLGGLWLVARSGAAATPFARLAVSGSGVLGLVAIRYVVWFALVAAAVLPVLLDAVWAPSSARRRAGVNIALASIAIAAAASLTAAVAAHGASWFERGYPGRAAGVVESAAAADPGLRVFADERYADWLLFEDPKLAGRVAYDVRFELLTSAQLSSLFHFRAEVGYDWQRAAAGYGLLVLDPGSDSGAVKLFEREPGSTVLYRDSNVVVLRRALPPPAA